MKKKKIDRRTRNYKEGYKAGIKYERNQMYVLDIGQFKLIGDKEYIKSIKNKYL